MMVNFDGSKTESNYVDGRWYTTETHWDENNDKEAVYEWDDGELVGEYRYLWQ